ncbi:hypothetical protein WICPIJ_009594 [Wickerhamomyces pijperi]|uniref:Uncharacterized protein n=1 Tax=Wickerhamomyces pijperi TaxID=599730 RepID=A0A9P8TCC6_WICPI|nr:hypothetical protein WICPIJ_009594 [Wickerhamomyces pijperi]
MVLIYPEKKTKKSRTYRTIYHCLVSKGYENGNEMKKKENQHEKTVSNKLMVLIVWTRRKTTMTRNCYYHAFLYFVEVELPVEEPFGVDCLEPDFRVNFLKLMELEPDDDEEEPEERLSFFPSGVAVVLPVDLPISELGETEFGLEPFGEVGKGLVMDGGDGGLEVGGDGFGDSDLTRSRPSLTIETTGEEVPSLVNEILVDGLGVELLLAVALAVALEPVPFLRLNGSEEATTNLLLVEILIGVENLIETLVFSNNVTIGVPCFGTAGAEEGTGTGAGLASAATGAATGAAAFVFELVLALGILTKIGLGVGVCAESVTATGEELGSGLTTTFKVGPMPLATCGARTIFFGSIIFILFSLLMTILPLPRLTAMIFFGLGISNLTINESWACTKTPTTSSK